VTSNRLHTLAIPNASGLSWAYSTFKQCPLKIIHIKSPVRAWEMVYIPFDEDPALMGLLKYTEIESPYVFDPPLIFYIEFPCAAHSEKPKHRILF
jgi:hypothetical protein